MQATQSLLSYLQVDLVLIASAVYVIVTALKKVFPALTGWKAMAMNILLTGASFVLISRPGDLRSPAFWASFMLAIASAAGIHGTVKAALEETPDPNYAPYRGPVGGLTGAKGYGSVKDASEALQSSRPATAREVAMKQAAAKMKDPSLKTIAIMALIGLSMALGCRPASTPVNPAALPAGAVDTVDATANQTLQTIHAFLAKVSTDVQTGAIHPSTQQRLAIDAANKALNVASLAEQAYHGGSGSNAAVLTAAVAAAQASFYSLQSSITEPAK